MAGLISKGIYELSLSKVISTEVDLCTLESEKFTETLMGISHVFSPRVSTTHYSLKAVSLKDRLVGEQWIEYTF